MAVVNKFEKMVVYDFSEEANGYAAYDAIHNLSEIGAIRSDKLKEENFKQGKMAEIAVYKSLLGAKGFVCEPYDFYRKNILKDPFDLILYNPIITSKQRVQTLMNEVYEELKNDYGIAHKLSPRTREKIRNAGIITVEVKSSNIKKLLDNLEVEKFGREELAEIKSGLEQKQFFFAPLFHQRNLDEIDFHTYCQNCINEGFVECDEQVEENVLKTEKKMLSDVFIRVFMDMESNTAIIYGGKTKEEILFPREVSSFKSNNIAFFKSPLTNAFALEDIGEKFFGIHKQVEEEPVNEQIKERKQNQIHFNYDMGPEQ